MEVREHVMSFAVCCTVAKLKFIKFIAVIRNKIPTFPFSKGHTIGM